jgi:hypothetical protein
MRRNFLRKKILRSAQNDRLGRDSARLSLTRELSSVSETEERVFATPKADDIFSLPPSFCCAKIHLPRQREACAHRGFMRDSRDDVGIVPYEKRTENAEMSHTNGLRLFSREEFSRWWFG